MDESVTGSVNPFEETLFEETLRRVTGRLSGCTGSPIRGLLTDLHNGVSGLEPNPGFVVQQLNGCAARAALGRSVDAEQDWRSR
jgi:hypothetical protein